MMILKNKFWFLKRKVYLNINSNNFKKNISKFRSILLSLLFGFLFGSIFIMSQNANPFLVITDIFHFSFEDWGAKIIKGYYSSLDKTLTWWAVYIIIGLAMIVSFKAGLFNIGVPAQMLLPGAMTLIIGIKFNKISQFGNITIAIILGIVLGAIVAMISGVLKAFFNIHEVLTTIMLNWFIWYIIRWIFTSNSSLMKDDTSGILTPGDKMSLDVNGRIFIISIILALITLIITWILLKKTVFGYKIQAVGANKDSSYYSGINPKIYGIIAMGFSGALAGLGGILYYLYLGQDIKINDVMMPLIGFDSIAIALVGAINIFGVIGSALLWAILKQGAISAAGVNNISNQVAMLLFGIIIYMTAISTLFLNYHPYLFIKKLVIIYKNESTKTKLINFNQKLKVLKKQYYDEKDDYQKEVLHAKLSTLKNERHFFIDEIYKKYLRSGKLGIRRNYYKINNVIFAFAVDSYISLEITTNNKINENKINYRQQLKILKEKYHWSIRIFGKIIKRYAHSYKNWIEDYQVILKQYQDNLSLIKNNYWVEVEKIYQYENLQIKKNIEGFNQDLNQYYNKKGKE